MSYRCCAALAAAVSMVFSPSVYAAEAVSDCWHADEAKAFRIQALQTMLMVDAIKCQDTIPETLASYNAFMTARHDMLVSNKYTVQAHFVRTLGPVDGSKASTDSDTLVANRLSAGPIDVARCQTSGMYARAAAQATPDDLLTMATILAKDADVLECPAPVLADARPTAMIIPIWKKPAPTASGVAAAPAVSVAAPAPAVANAIPVAATVRPAVAVKPNAVALADSASVAADRAETLKALQAAVVALTQVASSLAPQAAVPAEHEN